MPNTFRPRGSPTAEYSPEHDYTGWNLIYRGTMAPWGVYEKDGQTASGFAWPGMVTEPLEAGGRFFSPGGGFEQGPANVNAAGEANISPSWSPQERDAMTELLTLYGGNALNGTARAGASAIGNALADPARIGLRDYGTAAYKSLMHHNEPAVMGSIPSEFLPAVNYSVNNPKSPWSKDHGSLASLHLRGSDLKLLPPSNEVVGALTPDEAGYLNALMQTRKPESQTFNVIDGGLFSDTGRPSILGSALAAEQSPKGITAYHGSPHDFDKFDLSKIGTGEGAQAYGHGLYFAENEGVAKSYRNALSPSVLSTADGAAHTIAAKPSALSTSQAERVAASIKDAGSYDAAVANAQKAIAEAGNGPLSGMRKALAEDQLRALEAYAGTNPEVKSAGHMYQVRINANPEDFLDWDKPLSQQSGKVREKYLNALGAMGHQNPPAVMESAFATSGQGLENLLNAWSRYDRGKASSALNEAGIPGIRYLDQMSRNAGDGSRNYVVFDDNLIEILKKYGLGAASLYGLDSLSPPDQSQ